jgi:hypothetical protein
VPGTDGNTETLSPSPFNSKKKKNLSCGLVPIRFLQPGMLLCFLFGERIRVFDRRHRTLSLRLPQSQIPAICDSDTEIRGPKFPGPAIARIDNLAAKA